MFKVNHEYTKEDIYSILKVPSKKQKGPWNTGYTEYNNCFYLFVNIGVAGRTGHDYKNVWSGQDLVWYGKTKSHINQPFIKRLKSPDSKVQIFTRENDRASFIYKGYGISLRVENSSPVKITWKIIDTPVEIVKPHYINPELAWKIFYDNITDAYSNNQSFESPKLHNEYRIVSILNETVSIEKTTAAKRRKTEKTVLPDEISYNTFNSIIEKFNSSNGSIPKTKLKTGQVVIESAIVWFLPMLDWDENQRNIIYDYAYNLTNSSIRITYSYEAPDDSRLAYHTIFKRMRRGQNLLRKILLKQYNGKCCISDCRVKEVLNACHIEPHKLKGYNDSRNAFLLRSDIHDLWDMNLIGIHPETLIIHISPKLSNTEYSKFDKKRVSQRADNQLPNAVALKNRWDEFNKSV